jgi:hypothetical protein
VETGLGPAVLGLRGPQGGVEPTAQEAGAEQEVAGGQHPGGQPVNQAQLRPVQPSSVETDLFGGLGELSRRCLISYKGSGEGGIIRAK